jgi:hypothetical protein
MSDYSFEEFKSRKGRFSPSISINQSGGFGLSSGFHHRYTIDKYKGVKLYYDKIKGAVGIKFLEKEEDGMFRLKTRPNEKGGYFTAKSFIDAYAVDIKKVHGKYIPQRIEDAQFGEMFVIQLESKK